MWDGLIETVVSSAEGADSGVWGAVHADGPPESNVALLAHALLAGSKGALHKIITHDGATQKPKICDIEPQVCQIKPNKPILSATSDFKPKPQTLNRARQAPHATSELDARPASWCLRPP